MKNLEPTLNNSHTIPEQPTLSKESRFRKLTPEQIEMSRQRDAEISAIVIETLHKDNLEIFGTPIPDHLKD